AHGQFHSSTLSHFLNQCSSLATRDQNLSGSSTDSLYRRSYSSMLLTWACWLNSGGGGNLRCSCRMESMFVGSTTAFSGMENLNRRALVRAGQIGANCRSYFTQEACRGFKEQQESSPCKAEPLCPTSRAKWA